MCIRTVEEIGTTVQFSRHRHFEVFFNMGRASTRSHPLFDYCEKPPHFSRLLRVALGYGGGGGLISSKTPGLDEDDGNFVVYW